MPHPQFIILLIISLVFSCVSSSGIAANNQKRVIGVITFDARFLDAQRGLADGLKQLDFKDTQVQFVIHDLKRDLSQIPSIVNQLRQQRCDLIMTTTTPVVLAVKKVLQESDPIPVIFTMVADPLGSQVVSSLQSPGGHITGISYNAFSIMPKRLELFKEALPNMKNIAIFYNHGEAWLAEPIQQQFLPVAGSMGLRVTDYDVRGREDMAALTEHIDSTVEGLFMTPDPSIVSFFDDLVILSRKYKLPIMVIDNMLLEKGGIMGYSPTFYSIGLQAASMAVKILAGINPGRLSVQNPNEVRLVVSLKELKRLGLSLPDSFLSETDTLLR